MLLVQLSTLYVIVVTPLLVMFECGDILDVRILSLPFVTLVVCTYFSWSNYHLAQKCDPGYLVSSREQQHRVGPVAGRRCLPRLCAFFS